MRSSFFGLQVANAGLFVAQRQLDVTGHNISNANTEGYSRQRYITSAAPPPGGNAQFASMTKGKSGLGVETQTLDQIRDRFLDKQYRQETSKSNYWDTKAGTLYYIEDVFNGEAESRLDGIMNSFFNSVQEVSKNPTDEAIRTNLVQTTQKMTDIMHTYYSQLEDLMYQQDYELVQQVKSVNEYSQQVASLNENILKYEQGGQVANDLRDQRNLLLDNLSKLVDISYQEVGSGRYNINGLELTVLEVYIGADGMSEDNELVNHTAWRELEAWQGADNDVTNAMGGLVPPERELHGFRFLDNQIEIELTSGEIKGLMDIRDGNDKSNQGIPYFINQLDQLAKALVETFNEVHMKGYSVPYTDSNGEFHESSTRIPFFDESSLTVSTIRLSDELLASGFNFAASSEPVIKGEDGHFNTGNNISALNLIKDVKERNDIDVIGSFEGYFKSFISEMASEVSHANEMYSAEAVLTDSLTAQRLSVMGVSIDEEMTEMIRFQHAYNAAARTITAMDELLDVLINRTGRVGL